MTPTIDSGTLRGLYGHAGPFTSVYVDLRARGESEVWPRWRALTETLAEQGAPHAVLDSLTEHVLAHVPGPGVVAVIAAGEEVLLTAPMPGAAPADQAVHAGLPHVLPLLSWLQSHPAHVIALVDRTGADLIVHPSGAAEPVLGAVEGPDDEIERNAPGGWAQARYQHRAEDSWEHNAARVAEVLARTLHDHDAHLLLLAGDVRALQYLDEHLPAQVKHEVALRRLSGGRSADGSSGRRDEQVAGELRLAVTEETAGLLRLLDEERRPGGRTVDGARGTVAALARGQVRTLFLAPDTGAPRTAWYGPGATDVSTDAAQIARMGTRPEPARLVDVAARAALLTRADVRVVGPDEPGVPLEGIAALCRF